MSCFISKIFPLPMVLWMFFIFSLNLFSIIHVRCLFPLICNHWLSAYTLGSRGLTIWLEALSVGVGLGGRTTSNAHWWYGWAASLEDLQWGVPCLSWSDFVDEDPPVPWVKGVGLALLILESPWEAEGPVLAPLVCVRSYAPVSVHSPVLRPLLYLLQRITSFAGHSWKFGYLLWIWVFATSVHCWNNHSLVLTRGT